MLIDAFVSKHFYIRKKYIIRNYKMIILILFCIFVNKSPKRFIIFQKTAVDNFFNALLFYVHKL